jgi:hypothetical protein
MVCRAIPRRARLHRQRGYLGIGNRRALGGGAQTFAKFWSSPDFWAQLNTSIVPDHAAAGTTPTFTRATTKTFTDFEGRVRTALAGEACFTGARRVQNLLVNSNLSGTVGSGQVPTSWANTGGDNAVRTIVAETTPNGGNRSVSLRQTAVGGFQGFQQPQAKALNVTYVVSAQIRIPAGVTPCNCTVYFGSATPSALTLASAAQLAAQPAGVWIRYSASVTFTSDASGIFGIITPSVPTGQGFDVCEPQFELTVGQSNQNPSEVVITGLLSAPYQGAGVDGVKYFATLNGNTVTSNVVTEATGAAIGGTRNQSAYSPGTAVGTGFQTATDPGKLYGDLDLQFFGVLNNWTTAAQCFASQYGNPPSLSWTWDTGSASNWRLVLSFDGTTTTAYVCDNPIPFAAGTYGGVRVTRSATTGNITFYTSTDSGATWTQQGAVKAGTAGAISNSGHTVEVGARNNAQATLLAGTINRFRAFNVIGGTTPAVDFNPQEYVTGSSWTSSAGEVWSKTGGASILNFPLLGYDSWQASTNLCLQSENFGTTWTTVGTPTRSAAALRCGDVLLDQLSDADVGTVDGYRQVITFTGDATKAIAFYFAQGTSTSSAVRILDSTASANRLIAVITWSGGTPTVTMTTGTLLGVDALGNGVYRARVLTSAVTAANVNNLDFFPATDSAISAGGTGNAYFGGVQAENNTFCTPYIATTTATVTRNADQVSYPASGNVNTAVGAAYAESTLAVAGSGDPRIVGSDAGALDAPLLYNAPSFQARIYDGTLYTTSGLAAMTAGAITKLASGWGGSTMKAVMNGTLGNSEAFDGTMMLGATNIQLMFGGGTNAANGNVRNVRIWKSAAPDAYLVAGTAP